MANEAMPDASRAIAILAEERDTAVVTARPSLASTEPELPEDPMVMLVRGYVEDRALRTGAIVEVLVYPTGALIPRSEAIARRIDDYVLAPQQPSSTEYISGPMLTVNDTKLFGD